MALWSSRFRLENLRMRAALDWGFMVHTAIGDMDIFL